jgi:voltage-gated potassium channel
LGKFIAGVTMVIGLALFALPIGILATGFVNDLHRREFTITWSMLKRQPLFDGLEVDAMANILDAMRASIVRDHTQLAVTGHKAETLYLIVSGRARAEDETGSWNLEPGDVAGEEAIEDSAVYKRTIMTRTEMRLMVLAGEDLRRLSRKYPLLRRRLLHEVPW